MAAAQFVRPKEGCPPTRHLYVANLGPAIGVTLAEANTIFSAFGAVTDVCEAGEEGNRLYISFAEKESAEKAKAALHQRPCAAAGGRVMVIQFAELRATGQPTGPSQPEVYSDGQELGIPGLVYVPNFVSEDSERELLALVNSGNWHRLAKRRVQHYGYEFQYRSRDVDPQQELGAFPPPLRQVSERIEQLLRQLAELVGTLEEGGVNSSKRPEGNGAPPENFWPLDQLTVNEYPAGVGLSPHVDTHSAFQGAIVSLSLAGPAVMEFRRQRQTEASTGTSSSQNVDARSDAALDRRCLYLAPQSLLVLSGEARYAWQHYIPHRKGDLIGGSLVPRASRRISLTFRKVRWGPCQCEYSDCCDSQQGVREGGPKKAKEGGWMQMEGARERQLLESASTLGKEKPEVGEAHSNGVSSLGPRLESATKLTSEESSSRLEDREETSSVSGFSPFLVPDIERRHVHQVYDAIAMHFSATRFAKWPKVAQFLESLPGGSLVVDAGCGNGKYLGFNPACFFLGCDISAPLVGMASKRGFDCAVADALRLPYRSSSCDAAISIAVLHHLSSEVRRKQAIRELLRVVKSGDRVLITVWAREQEDPKLLGKWTPLIGTESWPEDLRPEEKKEQLTSEEPTIDALGADRRTEEGSASASRDKGEKEASASEEKRALGSIPEAQAAPAVKVGAGSIGSLSGGVTDTAGASQALHPGRAEQNEPLMESTSTAGAQEPGSGVQEYFVPWHLPYHRVEVGAANRDNERGLARRDPLKQALVYERYYHVFVEGELERLVTDVGGCHIVDHFFDKSNWCVIAAKD